MRRFAFWYNHEHYHSGIAYLHPVDVHNGTADQIITARQSVLDAAYTNNPGDSATSHPGRQPTRRSLDQQANRSDENLKNPAISP